MNEVALSDCGTFVRLLLGGGAECLVDTADYQAVFPFTWYRRPMGNTTYAMAHTTGGKKTGMLIHRLLLTPPKHLVVDHINKNGLDNRRSNLRICTRQENLWNQNGHGGTSTWKGVHWAAHAKKWRASICKDGITKKLGYFKTAEDAARAYNEAAKVSFGEYAQLNNVS